MFGRSLLRLRSASAALAGAWLVAGAVFAADGWPRFRGDSANTGVATDALPADLKLRWKFDTREARRSLAPATQSAPSSQPLEEPIQSTAAIADGVVYFGCDDGYAYAVALDSGVLRWAYHAGELVQSSPSVCGDLVLFGDDAGVLHAIERASGRKRWTFATEMSLLSGVNWADDDPERLVVGSYDGWLYCLSPDGRLLWKYETGDRLHATPAVIDGQVLIAGCDGQLHVVKLADGSSVRRVPLGSVTGASAAVTGELAVIPTQGQQVVALRWRDGGRAWVFEDTQRQFPFHASPALVGRRAIVAGRDKRVRSIDLERGTQEWQFMARGRVDSSPVVAGERVFVGSDDGHVYGLSLTTGEVLWQYEIGAGIAASPAIGAGSLVIGATDGILYCFGAAVGARGS